MRLSRIESWLRSPVLALLALAAVGAFAPRRAEAGCSHEVIWKGSSPQSLSELALLELEGVARSRQDLPPSAPAPRRGPCTGVLCSGSPAPLVPVVDVPPQSDDWCLPTAEPATPDRHAFARIVDDGGFRPVHNGGGVFHPPRLPSSRGS